jgi:hypothetical protein
VRDKNTFKGKTRGVQNKREQVQVVHALVDVEGQ